ncbi:MAG: hypothetical protein IJD67_06960 [Clostridia bacterium]|nr:hypothetical protein [Clostridia bacterium]
MEKMETIELSVVDILQTLLKRWWIIAVSAVLCAVIMFLYSTFAVTPLYGLKIQFYVAPEFGNAQATTAVTAYQTYTYAKEAILTYMKLLENDEFFDLMEENVKGKCTVNYTSGGLDAMISYKEVQDTDLFNATVVSAYPGDAYTVATVLAELAPERIHEIKGFDALKVTDKPKFERVAQVNNNVTRNTFAGAVIGAIFSALALIILKMFDVRIGDETDLTKVYDVPILGVIPNFDEIIKDNKRAYGYGYGYGGRPGENAKK